MKKIETFINLTDLKTFENCVSPNGDSLVKVVVDIQSGIFVLGGSLHVDEEDMLLDDGSEQQYLWGINLYSSKYESDDFIEYDSMINIRPGQNNPSRYIMDENIREKIKSIILSKIKKC